MDLSDRIAIETGISSKDSFKKIGKLLHRHPSTIAHEIKENRTFIPGNYFLRKDCRFVRQYVQRHVCGDESCEENCCRCRSVDSQKYCDKYVSRACHKFEKPPYVCNNCSEKKLCSKDKYIYSATLVSRPTFTEGITFAFKSLLTVAGVTSRISATVATSRTAGYFANSSFISSSFL